jgi:hypothetical protein
MTTKQLIEYLSEFPDETIVVLSEDDISEPCEFIALDSIDYRGDH